MNISRPFLTKSSEKFFSSPEYYIEERTRLTSPVAFSMFPKFSNILLQSIPSKHLKSGLSYSTLLNFQKNEIIQQSTKKKQIITYKPQSKIFAQLNNAISVNKIEFIENIPIRKRRLSV